MVLSGDTFRFQVPKPSSGGATAWSGANGVCPSSAVANVAAAAKTAALTVLNEIIFDVLQVQLTPGGDAWRVVSASR